MRRYYAALRFPVAPCLFVVGFAAAVTPQLRGDDTLKPLTTVREIRALSADQTRQSRSVHLRGVVTVRSGWKSSFFFEDGSAGISVDPIGESSELSRGQLVEITGFTGPGLFAPVVIARSVVVRGTGQLPPARLAGIGRLEGGKQDSQWLAIRGIVRSALVKESWGRSVLFLEVDIGGGTLVNVRIRDFSEGGWERLPGATVTVRGVCGTVFNDKRQFAGIRLFAENLRDVTLERPAPTDPFAIPVRPLGSLLQFGDVQESIRRVAVRGTVTYAAPGRGFYIQDAYQGVFVQSRQPDPVMVGTQLDVVGYPVAGLYSPKVVDALFRDSGRAQPIAGIAKAASDMILVKDGFPEAPWESMLVQLKGRLVEEVGARGENLLFLEDGRTVFTARLPKSAQHDEKFGVGSLLQITGICSVKTDEDNEVRSFEILLRSDGDVVMLESPPWWTPRHASWVVALLALVLLATSVCLAIVRRHERLQTLVVTDTLTGLYNRRGFSLLAERRRELAVLRNHSFWIFYMDVDRFKEINDSLGHKEGDAALRSVAELLRGCFRKSDIIGRLGGDEFAVYAAETPERSRELLEQKLAVIATQFRQAGRTFGFSLSIGILACDGSLGALPIEELLDKADALMYRHKRDRVRGPAALGSLAAAVSVDSPDSTTQSAEASEVV